MAVIDPWHGAGMQTLRRAFPDLLETYKMHHVVDLAGDPLGRLSTHHRRNSKLAMNALDIEICAEPSAFAVDWLRLYGTLASRHGITGAANFSSHSLTAQLGLPGLTALRASKDGVTVGMTLWLANERHVYYHLGAYSEEGYDRRASFGMFWTAISHFGRLGLDGINLGAGAGTTGDSSDGLSRFKAGWASRTLPAWLAGRIGDAAAYGSLCDAYGEPRQGNFFPAYRRSEALR
jgi:hypothetical protein